MSVAGGQAVLQDVATVGADLLIGDGGEMVDREERGVGKPTRQADHSGSLGVFEQISDG